MIHGLLAMVDFRIFNFSGLLLSVYEKKSIGFLGLIVLSWQILDFLDGFGIS